MLKRIFNIIVMIAVAVSLINAQNLLYLEKNDMSSAQNIEINLVLSNADTVAGIQATLKLSKAIIKLDTIIVSRNDLLFKYYSPDSVTTNFIFFASAGHEFKPGKTTIAKIKFKTLNYNQNDSVSINFENLLMIAPKARKLNATALGLTFKLEDGKNKDVGIKFNISYSSIIVWLKNSERVKKLSVEFKLKNGSVAEFASLMPRSAGFMKMNYEIKNDFVYINLSAKDSNGLDPGEGDIFFITGKFNSTDDIEILKIEILSSNGTIMIPNFKLITTDIYPINFKLEQNYPNPFNPATTIKFIIPKETKVQIAVFDITGRIVKILIDEKLPAGEHFIVWDGTDKNGARVSSGTYIYRMITNEFVDSKKMIFTK